MPENMGAGVALFDADQDGRLDVYFVQGAPLAEAGRDARATDRLYLHASWAEVDRSRRAREQPPRSYRLTEVYFRLLEPQTQP